MRVIALDLGSKRVGVAVSDLHGQSARTMVKATVAGEPTHVVLDCASRRLKASREELFDAVQGELTESHRFASCCSTVRKSRRASAASIFVCSMASPASPTAACDGAKTRSDGRCGGRRGETLLNISGRRNLETTCSERIWRPAEIKIRTARRNFNPV